MLKAMIWKFIKLDFLEALVIEFNGLKVVRREMGSEIDVIYERLKYKFHYLAGKEL
jgi:hypothetical protein